MQRLTVVRYTTRPDHSDENETLSRAVFDQLRVEKPDGVAYAVFRKGSEFFHIFINTRRNDSSPLTDLPAFRAFSESGPSRHAAPPEVIREDLEMLESHGLKVWN